MGRVIVPSSVEQGMKALENFSKIVEDAIDIMADDLVSSRGIITKNLSQNAQNNSTYVPLKPKTKARKIRKKKPFALVDSGKMKSMVRGTTKGKIKNARTITFKAKVPKYGKFHQPDGSEKAKKGTKVGNLPIRRFFEIKRADKAAFNRMKKEAFRKALSKVGVHI